MKPHLSKFDNIFVVDTTDQFLNLLSQLLETKKYLKEFATIRNRYVTLIRNEITQKYTKSANIWLKASTGDYVILLNSDTAVSLNWTKKLIECAEQSSNIDMI